MIVAGGMRGIIEQVRSGEFPEEAKMLVDIIDKLESENRRLHGRMTLEEAVDEAVKRGDIE